MSCGRASAAGGQLLSCHAPSWWAELCWYPTRVETPRKPHLRYGGRSGPFRAPGGPQRCRTGAVLLPRPSEAAGVLEARWAPSRGLCWHLAPLTGAWRHARGQHTSDMRARVPSHGSILYTGASEASRGLYCSAVVDSLSRTPRAPAPCLSLASEPAAVVSPRA